MDAGSVALIVGLITVGLITVLPMSYLKALGGLLILSTILAIIIDAARLVAR